LWDECGGIFNKHSAEACARNTQKSMMLCFRDELDGTDKCAKKFNAAAIGDTGELMDEDESGDNTKEWKKTIRFLYDKTKEDGKCSLHNAGSSVSRLVNIFFCNKNRRETNVPQ
jgi:hypothetical protein